MKTLLSVNELAKRWRIHPNTLANWRYSDKGIPYTKIGARVRYDLKDVETYEIMNNKIIEKGK